MLKRPVSLFILLLSLCFQVHANTENTLVVAYGDHDGMPYAMEEHDKLSAGIIKDISTELAAFLDINIEYHKIPRQRLERYLENNRIHVVLISNPKWLKNHDKLQWSDAIFKEQDLIVVRADNDKAYNSIEDLKGITIGTIRGYHYATLQPYFKEKYFVRYDVSNLEVNFIRLSLDRIDALVDANILINYYLKESDKFKEFRILPFPISSQDIHAAISPNAPISLAKFNQALSQLKSQGVIEAILEKYQVNKIKSPITNE